MSGPQPPAQAARDLQALLSQPDVEIPPEVRDFLAEPFSAELLEMVAYTDVAWSRVYRVRQKDVQRTVCSWCDGSRVGLRWIGA